MLARPLCWRGSLPLRALLHPITITGLDLHFELELSLSRDFGTDSLEVGAPPSRHPVQNPSPPAAPARKCQPRANFWLFSNCSDCLLTAALHQSTTGESHLARSSISHPSASASDRSGHTAKRTAFVQSPHTNSHHGRFHRRHVRCVHAHASRSSRRVATTSRDVWKAPTVGIDQTL